jgi:quercetin dioxygenase-like cupin family protein
MRRQVAFGMLCVSSLVLSACSNPERATAPAPGDPATAAAPAQAAEAPVDQNRPFLRVNLDKIEWRKADGNDLGVQTAIVEGDPAKPGYYLVVNRFPAGVMSRPHYHNDERHAIVLKGTWYTDEGDVFRPKETVPLKAGDYMRHPAGGHHYDGALDEEVIVAISGTGPSRTISLDGGDRWGKSK